MQVMGGAVGALIIKDPKGTLPIGVETARDVLFLAALHHPAMECNNGSTEIVHGLPPVLCESQDSLFKLEDNRSQDRNK